MTDPNKQTGLLMVFSAPSGAGKTTLLMACKEAYPDLVYSISATTREPRPGERHGEHYFFLSRPEFERMIERGEFAEWEDVHGNLYGTPRSCIDDAIGSGRHVIMDIDVKGKLKLDAVYPEAIGVLVIPPSLEELEQRLRRRGTESEESIRTRIRNATRELDLANTRGRYEYTIVNDSLKRARAQTVALVGELIGRA
jgi:guanylate kinase